MKKASGRGCSKAVVNKLSNMEVVGSNPAGCWAFFLFFFPTSLHQWSVLNQVPEGGASLTGVVKALNKWMPSCAA